MKIFLPHNWSPREYQKPLWDYLGGGGKRAAACWPRRHGKDDVMLHHNACAAFERVGNYWYMLPEYNQCRKAIWDAVNPHSGKKRIDEAFPPEIRSNTLNQEMKIVFPNGSTFQLMGSDNYNALVGSPPIGLTYSEYALSNPTSWGYLRPILLENGGWASFNSTPRGKNHFYKLIQMAKSDPDWFGQILTNNETHLFTDEQLQSELKELQNEHGDTYGRALWLQEYFCSFDAAIPGSIWGESIASLEQDGRVQEIEYNRDYPVFTAWDLGRSDATSIWFYQVIAGEVRIIDFYENNFKELPFYADIVKDKNYNYGMHWLPHDAFAKRMGMGGKSMMQQLFDLDIGKIGKVPNMSKRDGIEAARATFHKVFFDYKCSEGLEHLKSYHRKYDETKKTFTDEPVHDEHSHASDAWIYLSLTWRQSAPQSVEPTLQERLHAGNVVNLNFGQMKKEHFRNKRRANLNEC